MSVCALFVSQQLSIQRDASREEQKAHDSAICIILGIQESAVRACVMADPPTENDSILQTENDSTSRQQDQHQTRRWRTRTDSHESRPREATELDDYMTPSTASLSSGEYRVMPRHSNSQRSSIRREDQSFPALRRFWSRHVALTVPQKQNRDYFGECIDYFRTVLPEPANLLCTSNETTCFVHLQDLTIQQQHY
jgi:hypothetical protein